MGRAGLELGRQVAWLEAIQQHAADHAPAAQEGRHGLQQLALAVEHAHARRPQHLVTAEDEEIDVQDLHVGLLVRHALGPVQQRQGAGLVARRMISAAGLIVPSTLEIAVKATSLVRSLSNSSSASKRSRPSSLSGMCRSTAPRRSASCCQGTRLA